MRYNTSNEIEVGDTVRNVGSSHHPGKEFIVQDVDHDGVVLDESGWAYDSFCLEIMEGKEERELREAQEQIIVVEIYDDQMAELLMGAKCLDLCRAYNEGQFDSTDLAEGVYAIFEGQNQ